MIQRSTILVLGLSQQVGWGITYYAIAILDRAIAQDLGLTRTMSHAGFCGALIVMGLCSGWIGRQIDEHGGRKLMMAGSVLMAVCFAGLALAQGLISYALAWAVMGVAMRMTLYEAAFATLVRIAGPAHSQQARQAIAWVTLFGGLASTTFWPIGQAINEAWGWRATFWAYGGFALLTLALHALVPVAASRAEQELLAEQALSAGTLTPPLAQTPADQRYAAWLYALIAVLSSFLVAAMSAHAIGMLTALGLAAGTAVWISTLRGVAQTVARVWGTWFVRDWTPLSLGAFAAALVLPCFVAVLLIPLAAGRDDQAFVMTTLAVLFSVFFGMGVGIQTITRGTQPLVLFDPRIYGERVGKLTAPSLLLSALAPFIYAWMMDHWGVIASLWLSLGLAVAMVVASVALWWRFRVAPSRTG